MALLHPSELFARIHTRDGYRHIGRELSYKDFIDHDNHVIYVCFQGSNGLSDWLHNLLAIPTNMEPYRGCGWRVHKGFARVWRSGNDTVLLESRELWDKFRRSRPLPSGGWGPYELVFCGFSHGAALAQLAAENYNFRFGKRCQCICFGSPKLAWGSPAADRLRSSMMLTNWINKADAVTKVPLRKWGYRHVLTNIVNVRRIPLLSVLRVNKHHQIYGRREIYP